ncbi:hypothetical protein D3C81_2029610 [compost metagenome]
MPEPEGPELRTALPQHRCGRQEQYGMLQQHNLGGGHRLQQNDPEQRIHAPQRRSQQYQPETAAEGFA